MDIETLKQLPEELQVAAYDEYALEYFMSECDGHRRIQEMARAELAKAIQAEKERRRDMAQNG